jgi:hypothetical protein
MVADDSHCAVHEEGIRRVGRSSQETDDERSREDMGGVYWPENTGWVAGFVEVPTTRNEEDDDGGVEGCSWWGRGWPELAETGEEQKEEDEDGLQCEFVRVSMERGTSYVGWECLRGI